MLWESAAVERITVKKESQAVFANGELKGYPLSQNLFDFFSGGIKGPQGGAHNSENYRDFWISTMGTVSSGANKVEMSSDHSNVQLTLRELNGNGQGDSQIISPEFKKQAGSTGVISFEASISNAGPGDTFEVVLWALKDGVWSPQVIAPDTRGDTQRYTVPLSEADDVIYRLSFAAKDGGDKGGGKNKAITVTIDGFWYAFPPDGEDDIDTIWDVTRAEGSLLQGFTGDPQDYDLYVKHASGAYEKISAATSINYVQGNLQVGDDGVYTFTPHTSLFAGAANGSHEQFTLDYYLVAKGAVDPDAKIENTLTIDVEFLAVDMDFRYVKAEPTILGDNNVNEIFYWEADAIDNAGSPRQFVIENFEDDNGRDVLDLRDLLIHEEHASDLSQFLHVSTQTHPDNAQQTDTIIEVSSRGEMLTQGSDLRITLSQVDLLPATSQDQNALIKQLIQTGKLLIDGH